MALSGASEFQVRGWVRQVKLYGSKKEKKQVLKKDGEYRLSLRLVDEMATKTAPVYLPPNPPQPPLQPPYASLPPPNPTPFGHSHTDKLIGILERQMEEKDKQISSLHLKLDGFLERLRELNVIVHDLQKKIQQLHTEPAQQKWDDTLPEPPYFAATGREEPARELLSLPHRSFQDWLSAFVKGEKD